MSSAKRDSILTHNHGRCNKGEFSGHLADPEKSFYSAEATIKTGGSAIKSNTVSFSIVPRIDSVIVTNWPSYPPMHCVGTLSCDTVATVIKAKIDDAYGDYNYRYYAPGLQHARNINIWNSAQNDSNFYFWDVGSPKKRYYEKENKQIQVRNWPVNKFGALSYVWIIIYDRRIGNSGYDVRYTGDDIVHDTSGQWGHNWFVPLNTFEKWFAWMEPEAYMRNLVYSEVKNIKNEIILQADTAATGAKAHKLIFAPMTPSSSWDIVDWALTHVGVPYAILDATVKIPYIKIDCSSLVTTAKIQTIGAQNNTLYRIGEMNTVSYRDTVYRGVHITRKVTDPIHDNEFNQDYCRGQLLFVLNRHTLGRHIMILTYASDFDPITKIPNYIEIVHAPGDAWPMGKVRYDVTERVKHLYPPYVKGLLGGDFYWTFLKWQY